MRKRSLLLLAGGFFVPLAAADNTGGVFGPVVNEGHRSWQYRIAHDLDTHSTKWRLHYQQSLDERLMWRVLAQARKTQARDNDFDFIQGELFWQLADLRPGWRSGVRFDLRLRDDDRPHQLGLNWMHDVQLAPKWSARMLALSTLQFGDNDASGLFLQTRGSVTYQANAQTNLSLSLFSDYGSTSDWKTASHQLGPTLQMRLGSGWSLLLGYLGGVSDRAPDHQARFWLTKSL